MQNAIEMLEYFNVSSSWEKLGQFENYLCTFLMIISLKSHQYRRLPQTLEFLLNCMIIIFNTYACLSIIASQHLRFRNIFPSCLIRIILTQLIQTHFQWSFLFPHCYLDTHHTKPRLEWNRWSRSTRSCQCSTNQQSNNNPSSHHFIINPLFTQTLTTLNLSSNKIGAKGAQYLANALQINEVTTILLLITSSLTHFSLRHSSH